MAFEDLPDEFGPLTDSAILAIRRAYGLNAERHDVEVGDDAVVFGIAVYRNSWFLVEREVADLDDWTSARPAGSLVIAGARHRVHVYRCGQNADVELDGFRLDDERRSATQRLIVEANSVQLALPLDEMVLDPVSVGSEDLVELVIVHAGNPIDGCCGIWIGAPITGEVATSTWAWIEPLWLLDESGTGATQPARSNPPTRHDELPEPEISLEPVGKADLEQSERP